MTKTSDVENNKNERIICSHVQCNISCLFQCNDAIETLHADSMWIVQLERVDEPDSGIGRGSSVMTGGRDNCPP